VAVEANELHERMHGAMETMILNSIKYHPIALDVGPVLVAENSDLLPARDYCEQHFQT
jgi:hypothetical protein